MVKFVKFRSPDLGEISGLGLSFLSIYEIFLGSSDIAPPHTPKGSPAWATAYIAREFKACEDRFQRLRNETVTCAHPISGLQTDFVYSFIPNSFPTMTLPVFEVFGMGVSQFCLAFCSLTSRVTHIVVPQLDCVLYDLDDSRATFVWEAFAAQRLKGNPKLEDRRRVGILDMVANHAHQAMNHLSGLQRLLDNGSTKQIDEVWVFGTEFFGRTEDIFSDFAPKIRHMNRRTASEELHSLRCDPMKIGSNFFTLALLERIRAKTNNFRISKLRPNRWPLLAVTVRSVDRRCLNLDQVVADIVYGLIDKFPRIGIILDGWTSAEVAPIAASNVVTSLLGPNFVRLREEALLCKSISERLPAETIVANVVGMSFLESVQILNEADAYFSHVGTLQHKISWFSEVGGVVHGPRTELQRLESSYYSAESATLPNFLDLEDVVDVPNDASAPQHNDYRIIGTSHIIYCLEEMFAKRSISFA